MFNFCKHLSQSGHDWFCDCHRRDRYAAFDD